MLLQRRTECGLSRVNSSTSAEATWYMHCLCCIAGFKLPYACGDMALEEVHGFMAGYNKCDTAAYLMKLEYLMVQHAWQLLRMPAQSGAAAKALADFQQLHVPYFWDKNHVISTNVRHSKQAKYPRHVKSLLYQAVVWMQAQQDIFTLYEAVNVLMAVLNDTELPVTAEAVVPLSQFTPPRMRRALSIRLADSVSSAAAVMRNPLLAGVTCSGGQILCVSYGPVSWC